VFLWNLPLIPEDGGNAIWSPKGDEIIGHAPIPSEISTDRKLGSGS